MVLKQAENERCTFIRGMAAASTIRVNNALLDELQDGWDTRPIDTLPNPPAMMSDNHLTGNVHARTHHGVWVRPHRDPANTATRSVIKSFIDMSV